MIFQKALNDKLVEKLVVGCGLVLPMPMSVGLEEFDVVESEGEWPFRGVVGNLL